MIYVRHEHCAVASAMAYARKNWDVGVASVTCGPGLTQLITALPAAVRAHLPLVVFAGEAPLKSGWYNQAIDQAPIIKATGADYHTLHLPERMPLRCVTHLQGLGPGCHGIECVAQAPVSEHAHGIGAELQARTHFAEGRRLFDHGERHALARQRERCGEATDAAAHHQHGRSHAPMVSARGGAGRLRGCG